MPVGIGSLAFELRGDLNHNTAIRLFAPVRYSYYPYVKIIGTFLTKHFIKLKMGIGSNEMGN